MAAKQIAGEVNRAGGSRDIPLDTTRLTLAAARVERLDDAWPVRLALLLATTLALTLLPLLTVAPNRLTSGVGVALSEVFQGAQWLWLLPLACWAVCSCPQRWHRFNARSTHALMVLACGSWLTGLIWMVGLRSAQSSLGLGDAALMEASATARVSLGGGFWLLALLAWLTAADATRRMVLPAAAHWIVGLAILAPALALLSIGHLDALALLKEYDSRRDVFNDALWRHLVLVAGTLLPTVLIGGPLGIALFRRPRWRSPVMAMLNIVQTVPSIALFALLMAPLAALAMAVPALAAWGVRGIGLAPALIALTLYALLPMVSSVVAALDAVPASVTDAARGMGMGPNQIFLQVELPLAVPVLLSGVRVTTVQTLGLAVVAALIGAGGFGALVFQGVASSAIDLVVLGVVPVVALSAAVDAGFRALVTLWPWASAVGNADGTSAVVDVDVDAHSDADADAEAGAGIAGRTGAAA